MAWGYARNGNTGYFVRAVSYTNKMFMKAILGDNVTTLIISISASLALKLLVEVSRYQLPVL